MDNFEDLIKRIDALFEAGGEKDSREIIELLPDTLLEQAKKSDLYDYRANAYYLLDDYDRAVSDWGKAIEIDSQYADAYFNRGICLNIQGKYDLAINEFSTYLEIRKDDAEAYNRRGLARYNKGDNPGAIEDYSLSLEKDPDYDLAYYNRAIARQLTGDYDGAVSDFTHYIAKNPEDADAFNRRGITYSDKGEYDLAIQDYNKALEYNPDLLIVYYNRGIAWSSKNEYDNALKDFDVYLAKINGDPDAFNRRGNAWYCKGEYEKAIEDYNQAIKFNDKFHIAYCNRGNAWYNKGDLAKSLEDYDQAIRIKDDYAFAYQYRGKVWYDLGDYEKALADYVKAKSLDDKLANIDNSIKMVQEAMIQQQRVVQSLANTSEIEEKNKIEAEIESIIRTIKEAARSDVKTVVHYTKMSVADIYVKSKEARMHYSNAIYMNDPMEGKVIFDYFNDPAIEQAYNNGEKRTETSVYLGSYLPAEESNGRYSHEDELVMWRTYGKDEDGKEAAGCSVVISCDFFNSEPMTEESMYKVPPGLKKEDPNFIPYGPKKDDKVIISESPKMADPVTAKSFMKMEGTGEELLNVIYIFKGQNLVTNDPGKTIQSSLDRLKEQLRLLLALRDRNQLNRDFYKGIEVSIFLKLSRISYLFKSADYQYENEVRVIKYIPRGSKDIKFRQIQEPNKPGKRFHIESANYILPFIRRIYLGPKVENYQQWSFYFDYEIRERQKELEAMNPSPYVLEPSNIEIRKSECKFQ